MSHPLREMLRRKVSNCWRNSQIPFALPFLTFRNSNLTSPPQLHASFTTAADHFIDFLHSFLQEILSLPSQFHTLCLQIGKHSSVWSVSSHNFAAVLPGDSVVVANGLLYFFNIYSTLLIVRLVLTCTVCDPYLNIFRGLIPPLGGTLDLSLILAFLVLNAFTRTAAALPGELPVTEQAKQGLIRAPLHESTNVTTSQKKWMRRLLGNNRSRTSAAAK